MDDGLVMAAFKACGACCCLRTQHGRLVCCIMQIGCGTCMQILLAMLIKRICPCMPQIGVYNEESLQRLDLILSEASANGVRIILPFVNFWADLGGMQWYVDQVWTVANLQPSWEQRRSIFALHAWKTTHHRLEFWDLHALCSRLPVLLKNSLDSLPQACVTKEEISVASAGLDVHV